MLKLNGGNWSWWSSRTPSKCPKYWKWCVLQFHWSWGLSSYLIGEWNFPCGSLGIRIFIIISIGEKNHSWFSLVHEGWGGHWLVGKISNFHWTRKQAQGGVLEGYQGGKEYLVFFWGKQRRNGGVRKRIVLKYGRCCSWKRCVQTRTWKEVVCNNTWSGVHGRISMTKPLHFYLR